MGNNQPKAPNKTNTSTKTPTKTNNTNNTVFSPIPLKVLTESDHSNTKNTETRNQNNK